MDPHVDPNLDVAPSWLDAVLRRIAQLDTAGIDATLEWATYRLVVVSASVTLLGIGGMNERRFLVKRPREPWRG
jgi:hypothetical protein